jgi:hypothetical protein
MSAAEPASSEHASQIETANAQRTRFSEVMDKIRLRADTSAKAFAALGSTVVWAFGISKFADLYPYPDGIDGGWGFLVVLAFMVLAIVVALISFRLFRVNQPIVMRTSVSDIRVAGEKLKREDEDCVVPVYERMADHNGVESLAALEARAKRFQRVADLRPDDDPLAKNLREQADLINAEVRATMATAAMDVIRRRSFRAVADGWAIGAYTAFVVAVLVFALTTDYIASVREQPTIDKAAVELEKARVDFATACITAEEKGVGGLSEICKAHPAETTTTDEPPAASQAEAALVELATKLSECRVAALSSTTTPTSSCLPIEKSLRTLLGSLPED